MPVNVPLTNANVENLSRHELLSWVNQTTSSKYGKIEDLCSGTAYCQLMELLFPGTIPMKKVKLDAKLEHEYIHNLKVFQNAFAKIDISKSVPIERLIKGRFQDNFEFLQWFKKFYDSNLAEKENQSNTEKLKPEVQNVNRNSAKKLEDTPFGGKYLGIPKRKLLSSTPKSEADRAEELLKPKSPSHLEMLVEQTNELKEKVELLTSERNFYFDKLRKIEIIVDTEETKGALCMFLKRVKEVLYAE